MLNPPRHDISCLHFMLLLAYSCGIVGISGEFRFAMGQHRGGSITISSVLAKLREREEAISSVDLQWTETRTEAAGARWSPSDGNAARHVRRLPSGPVPAEDTTSEAAGSLLIDGTSMRIETESDEFSSAAQAFKRFKNISSYDGRESRTLKIFDAPHGKQGKIYGDPYNVSISMLYLEPLLLAFRPFRSVTKNWGGDTGTTESTLRLLPDRGNVNNLDCVILGTGTGPTRELYWVAPDLGFVIVRKSIVSGGRPATQMTLDYAKADTDYALPSGWTISALDTDTGRLLRSYNATVRNTMIGRPIDRDRFVLAFPPGTHVSDTRAYGVTNAYVESHSGWLGEWWMATLFALIVLGLAAFGRRYFRRRAA